MRPRAGLAVIGGTRGVRLAATRSAVVVAVVIGLSSGCATIRQHSTLETEQILSAAGFHMKLTDTPEKLAHLRTYAYADPEVGRCLYAGTASAVPGLPAARTAEAACR